MNELLTLVDLDTFISTRQGLHCVAEHVVAKARYVDDGEIRLSASSSGFATSLLADGSRVRIDADELVVDGPGGSRRHHLSTVGEAAEFIGVEPGFPSELYPPATPLQVDEPLCLDRHAAKALTAWNAFCAELLHSLATEIAVANPSPLILWPEHFDQAFYTEDADETYRANYGASPGDDAHPEPYLYVGPWQTSRADPFWNASSFNGAVLPLSFLVDSASSVDTGMQFFHTARTVLTAR
ncbi:MAG: hypothetical protein ABI862_01165 [Ilumatobacteraceae bacterium]